MPELTLEIGGHLFEIACEPGQEKSLESAAKLLDTEARKIGDDSGRMTERRMLLIAGLMLGDTMNAVEDRLATTLEHLRLAEERVRIAEAKAAMLAANALKLETEAGHRGQGSDIARLRDDHAAAVDLLERVLAEVNAMADAASAGGKS